MVSCVELAQSKQASLPPLLGKNIPKDHDGIFSPVLPTSIPVPPIDINLALFPSGNCVMFSVFCDNELLFYFSIYHTVASLDCGRVTLLAQDNTKAFTSTLQTIIPAEYFPHGYTEIISEFFGISTFILSE